MDEHRDLEYIYRVRQKTSITLAQDTLRAIDEIAGSRSNRSRIIERAVLAYVEQERRRIRDERDRKILDDRAEELNREFADFLDLQAPL